MATRWFVHVLHDIQLALEESNYGHLAQLPIIENITAELTGSVQYGESGPSLITTCTNDLFPELWEFKVAD